MNPATSRRHRHLRGVDLGEGEGAEHVDDDLDVDFADALQRAPVERVLVEQLARLGRFDVAATEVDAVTFEEADLLFGQNERGVLRDGLLEAERSWRSHSCRNRWRVIVARWYCSLYGTWRCHMTKMIFNHLAPSARSAWRCACPRAVAGRSTLGPRDSRAARGRPPDRPHAATPWSCPGFVDGKGLSVWSWTGTG
jgi:hypothetical protein